MNKWKVPYIDLPLHYKNIEIETMTEIKRVLESGSFILRKDVDDFENNMANFLKCKYVVGVNSGTDALFLALKAAGIKTGDEVITVANTFVATIATIAHCGAKPILVDIKDDFNIDEKKICEEITNKTKAILPVHLNGRCCNMDSIMEIAKKHNLIVIEDSCQALGAKYNNKNAGTFGLMGCFSLHPMKIMNVPGDGGFISTNDLNLYEKLKLLRNHGQKTKSNLAMFGYSSRLDNLHAAIANLKFKYLNKWIERRREIALEYEHNLNKYNIELPIPPENTTYYDVYNSYVIKTFKRDSLYNYLLKNGIESFIHIPQPLYKYFDLGIESKKLVNNEQICSTNLSIPIFPEMTKDQICYVTNKINGFFKEVIEYE